MGELIHAAALAPAAAATCCVVVDRGRRRGAEVAASVVMLVAMIDAASGNRFVPVVMWVAVLLLGGMALGVTGGRRSRALAADRSMTVHAAIGCIVMASLLALMAGTGALAGAHHAGSATLLTAVVLTISAAYAGASFLGARRGRWQERAQRIGMGGATLAMGVAALM